MPKKTTNRPAEKALSSNPHHFDTPAPDKRSDKRTKESVNTDQNQVTHPAPERSNEHGGFKGPEPTRFGDWEKNGRCIDF